MKLKRILGITLSILTAGLISMGLTSSYATTETILTRDNMGNSLTRERALKLGLVQIGKSGYGYTINGVNGGNNVSKVVFKIASYPTDGEATNANLSLEDAIYCIKGGPGFNSEEGRMDPVTYDIYTDMKGDRAGELLSKYINLLPDAQNYGSILWLLDNFYIPSSANAAAEKQALLQAAEDYTAGSDVEVIAGDNLLTDDDIEMIQQIALWHFTNSANDGTGFYVGNIISPQITKAQREPGQYTDLSLVDDYVALGSLLSQSNNGYDSKTADDRENYAKGLYKYFIETAATKTDYTTSESSAPLTLNSNVTSTIEGSKYILGPYRITKTSEVAYTGFNAIVTDQNGDEITGYTLYELDGQGNKVQTSKTIEQLIGKDFYIGLPTTVSHTQVKLTITGSYKGGTQIQLLTSSANPDSEQPLALITRADKQFTLTNTVSIVKAGKYDIEIQKVDENGAVIESNSTKFSVNTSPVITGIDGLELTTVKGIASIFDITINGEGTTTYTFKEIVAPEGYIGLSSSIILKVTTGKVGNDYVITEAKIEPAVEGVTLENQSGKIVIKVENRKDESKPFDLALRKFITEINGEVLVDENGKYLREPEVDVSKLNTTDENGNKITTAIYNHPKTPVQVQVGDIVTYTIRVYNEGETDGYAARVTDYLPPELEFINDMVNDEENTLFNASYGWLIDPDNDRKITTSHLSKETNSEDNLIKAFDGTTLDYRDIKVRCKVVDPKENEKKITNIAEVTLHTDSNGSAVTDRDSEPGNVVLPSDENLPNYKDDEINKPYVPGQQDDDDFEKLILKPFDLALRKFITEINGKALVDENGKYLREPQVDVSKLNTTDANGNKITTAIYNHPKNPIQVQVGDIVTYTIRVYNEGEIDGYASKITDYLPPELQFINDMDHDKENTLFNQNYGWTVDENNSRKISTTYLSKEAKEDNLLQAFNGTTLDYKDIKVRCKVIEPDEAEKKITNIAEITLHTNSKGQEITDRDSEPGNVVLPSDENLPNYKDDEIHKSYIPGQQDDDDFEKVIVKSFDLALRKFITAVNETEITNRIPQFVIDEDGNYKYEHTKEPVEVENGNIVTYTLRIFNEGRADGYAKEIKDDIPEGLEFLPEHELNEEYRWVMYDEDGNETTDVTKAVTIRTDYLSKEQEKEEYGNLITGFDPETMESPNYKDVKVAFKVTEPQTSDRIIINTAEISDDSDKEGNPVNDKDSIPDNDKPKEDDIDIEKIKVKYFDLALKKWVTQAIVTEKGKETIIESGHTGDENPEPIVKVELYRKNIKNVTVKFRYKIKVTNEGEIAGYVKEISDYIPQGLKFVQEDNPKWREENGKVVTDQLKDTLLKPGESATVEILLTWINDEENMGVMTNIAEISKDYNDSNTPDIDSTPNNRVPGEDDIDDAPVMITVSTGSVPTYIGLTTVILVMVAGGIFLIRKYVL